LGGRFAKAQEGAFGYEYVDDTLNIQLSTDYDFFCTDEVLKLVLTFDRDAFLKEKNEEDPDYLPAVIDIHLSDTLILTHDIRIRPRGNFRRNYCSFPPIMLNLKRSDIEIDAIANQGTIKLVTHCHNQNVFQDYVFKEFLAYRLFCNITPYSFKTRLVHIDYVDSQGNSDVLTRYGFMIENEDIMASRNNALVIDGEALKQDDMIENMMARVAVFNYMIGNFDWQLAKPHNMVIIKSLEIFSEKAIPVPYDFDFSGIVNTNYATVPSRLTIRNVTDRVYLGSCSLNEDLGEVIDEFIAMKSTFYDIIDSFEPGSARLKRQLTSYLNEFYRLAENKNLLLNIFARECVNR